MKREAGRKREKFYGDESRMIKDEEMFLHIHFTSVLVASSSFRFSHRAIGRKARAFRNPLLLFILVGINSFSLLFFLSPAIVRGLMRLGVIT